MAISLTFSDFLLESKIYQGKLNPILWKDEKIDEDTRKKLVAIAKDFYKDLKLEIPIKDIQLTGSLANFNWTKYSDLDVHVLMDFKKINKDIKLVKRALDGARFVWNLRHPVYIKEHDVELYAQDMNEQHVSSGLFSLLNNEWIKKPVYNKPNIDQLDIDRKAEGYISEIEDAEKELAKATPERAKEVYNRLKKLKEKIMNARKEGLADDGEFSIENMTFKKLRNEKWIEKILDLESKTYSKIYSE